MNAFDRVVLLATGLVAIYLVYRFYQEYSRTNKVHNLYYLAAFAVLLVAGLLLIFLGFDILPSPWVIIASTLIPLGISLGLVTEFYPEREKQYLAFALIGVVLIAVTRFADMSGATVVLIIFHSIAGLLILLIPILAVRSDKAPCGFYWVAVGGVLIDLGGMALAFLKTGKQLLFFSEDLVMTILAPLLLLMALAFAWGFMKKIAAERG